MTWLVFTDLDGTLLDHDDYSYHAAESVLAELRQADISVVIVTSKTRAEVEPLWRALQLRSPFVVENGAAIYAPLDSAWVRPDWCERSGLACRVLASEVQGEEFWSSLLDDVTDSYQRFSQLSPAQVADITGLSIASASLALQREFSDPLYWSGSHDARHAFINRLQEQGYRVVCGGRFVHVLQGSDKGQAVRYLTQHARVHWPTVLTTLALGDGGNDVSMLEVADIAVRVRSLHHDFPVVAHERVFSTNGVGPEGWAEAIRHFILPEPSYNKR